MLRTLFLCLAGFSALSQPAVAACTIDIPGVHCAKPRTEVAKGNLRPDAACLLNARAAGCVTPAAVSGAPLADGAPMPLEARLLFNPEYYGLPPVSGHWRYYVFAGEIYRVHPATMQVLERIDGGNRRLF